VSVSPDSKPVLSRWVGPVAVLPLVLAVLATYDQTLPFEVLAGIVIAGSLLLSLCFCVVGFKERWPWMLAWPFVFLLLLPFANVAFWLVYRRRRHKSL
jgi:hypothetical protein